LFVRQFAGPADTESTQYFGQLRDLEILAGDRHKYHVWKSMWEDLRALTATQARIHQGYLLNEHQQPLKETQIAARLLDTPQDTHDVLEALSAVHLMEYVPLPSFAEQRRGQAESKREKGEQDAPCDGKKRAAKSCGAQDVAKGADCPTPPTGQNGTVAIETGDSAPMAGDAAGADDRRERAGPLKGNGLNQNGNLNQNENGNGSAEGQAERKAMEGKAEPAVVPCPPTTQPLKPKEAEAEGAVEPARYAGSKPSPPSDTATVGTIIKQVLHRHAPGAQQFGEWIHHNLGLSNPVNSEEWRRQIGAFASIWGQAVESLSGEWLEKFSDYAKRRAIELGTQQGQYENYVKKWMSDAHWRIVNLRKKASRKHA
jgi:hypothetical protein